MEKNIYDLINETNTKLENYEVKKMSRLEEKRLLKQTLGESKKMKTSYKKYIAVASAAVICMGAVGAMPVMASTNPTAYRIASLLGMEKNLDDYATVVNKMVVDKGVSVGLGEVLYDQEGDVLIVTNLLSVDEKIEDIKSLATNSLHTRVYINGKELNTSSSAEVKLVDEHTIAFVTTYNMTEDFEGKNDITIRTRQLFVNDKEYRGNWDVNFSIDGTMFSEATQKVDINETLAGINGEVGIVKYVQNPLQESIYYTQDIYSFIELRGTDNNGNEVVFEAANGAYEDLYRLVLAPGYEIKDDATSLTLELYERKILPLETPEVTVLENGISTKTADISENFEATGEVITITLP